MTWTRRGTPEQPARVEEEQPLEDLPPIASGTVQSVSWLATRAVSALLGGCLLAGPAALVLVVGSWVGESSSSGATPPAVVADRSDERAAAGQFAQQVVTAWLTATIDDPAPLLALVPDGVVPAGSRTPFDVADPAVAGIEAVGEGWSVTVAATVTDARQTRARRFYRIPVQVTGGTVAALSLPSLVSGPRPTRPPADGYRTQVDPGTPIGVAVTEFLTAWLTGGEVSRYLTPGVVLSPPSPAAFTAAHVDELRAPGDTVDPAAPPSDGQRIRLLAAVTASVTDQQAAVTDFAVTLTARAGRWEVTAIDPAPAQPTDPIPAEPSPAPAGSTTHPTS